MEGVIYTCNLSLINPDWTLETPSGHFESFVNASQVNRYLKYHYKQYNFAVNRLSLSCTENMVASGLFRCQGHYLEGADTKS